MVRSKGSKYNQSRRRHGSYNMLNDKTLGIFLIGVIIFLLSRNGERKVTIETRTHMEHEPLKLSGKEITTRSGRTVFGFLGVPYAAPPIGDLRFKVRNNNIMPFFIYKCHMK